MVSKGKSYLPHVVFILIMTYAMSSFTVLGLALGLLPFLPMAFLDPRVCVLYALISFVLAAGLSVYHLASMIRRKKRWDDRVRQTA